MKSRGFTLVEILIAMAIFALVSVMAYRATDAMTQGEARLATEAAQWRALEQVFSKIETDLALAQPRMMKRGRETIPAWWGEYRGENAGYLQFARAPSRLPTAVLEQSSPPTGLRIAYEWQGGTLTLLYWGSFDTEEDTEPARYVLLTDIAFFELTYLNQDNVWVNSWQPTHLQSPPLPRAARVRIAGQDGAIVERIFAL
ncbi:MAG: type II secretion system minor pseudopilin GspJ [Burkholderiales bacterium]|jgi:general secretion pathway protein J|nr:type II secretion system minor pseudopilin GspJ [Burkholderiales bacterium]